MVKKALKHTFVRYVIVGVLSVGVDYGILLFAYHVLNAGLGIATTTGFLVGLVANFLLNKFWSFDASHGARHTATQGVMVAILVIFNLSVTNIVVIYLNKMQVGPEVSKVLTTLMITAWNYLLYKKHIFKKIEDEPIV